MTTIKLLDGQLQTIVEGEVAPLGFISDGDGAVNVSDIITPMYRGDLVSMRFVEVNFNGVKFCGQSDPPRAMADGTAMHFPPGNLAVSRLFTPTKGS